MAKNDTSPLEPAPAGVDGGKPEAAYFHPGTQPPIQQSKYGADHTHPHMGFSAPSGHGPNPGNVNAADASTPGHHVIPVGKFGPVSKGG